LLRRALSVRSSWICCRIPAVIWYRASSMQSHAVRRISIIGWKQNKAAAAEIYPKEIKRDFYSMELCCNLLIRCSVDQRFEISFSYQPAGRRTYTSN